MEALRYVLMILDTSHNTDRELEELARGLHGAALQGMKIRPNTKKIEDHRSCNDQEMSEFIDLREL